MERCIGGSLPRAAGREAAGRWKQSTGDISDGGAGRAILLEDPSGNVIELFEFKKD
jgi:hypothetical protein